jgi:hypothetical protein
MPHWGKGRRVIFRAALSEGFYGTCRNFVNILLYSETRGSPFDIVTRLLSDKTHSIPGTVQTDSVFHPACCTVSSKVHFPAVEARWSEDSDYTQLVLMLRMYRIYLN